MVTKQDVQGQDSKAKGTEGEQDAKSIEQLSEAEVRTYATTLLEENTGLKGEVGHKEGEIVRLQNTMKGIQKRDNKGDWDALHKRIDGIEDMFDLISDRLDAQYGEPEGTAKKTKAQARAEDRVKASQENTQTGQNDPEIQAYISFVKAMNLPLNDPMVIEAIGTEDNPRTVEEAIQHLMGKLNEKQSAEVKKTAEDEARVAKEKELQDLGLTDKGPDQPSGKSLDTSGMSGDQLLREGFRQLNKDKKK